MSVSSLPEWKQLLLERKRREEEERERREKQEEEKFANMPAWKRGIIQRRKVKQDSLGDRDKERDVCLPQADVRPSSDGLCDTDNSATVSLGSELSLSPDAGQWLDVVNTGSQVSVETIVPVHENPFIRTQSSRRKGRDADIGNEPEAKEREKEKLSPKRSQDVESGRGRDIELKIERFRDLSEGREKERSRNKSQGREKEWGGWEKDPIQWKESVKDAVREQEYLRVRKEEEDRETDSPTRPVSPLVPCLRTIRADNIIIIEQDRKVGSERRSRWRKTEEERPEEDHQGKRGMKMDLRDILVGGGSVTEIRASEVLIIKPSAKGGEGGGGKGSGGEDGEMMGNSDGRRESMGREFRTDMSWLRDKEKERPWGQATVIKDDRKDSLEDNVFVERGGRVSQLLSKFGERPKPPSRSKSSDNFLHPDRRKYSGDEDEQQSEADRRSTVLKSVPKRSFSFSDRVIKENGLEDNGDYERIDSDKTGAGVGKETPAKVRLGCARLSDEDRFVKHGERKLKDEEEKGGTMQRRNEAEISIRYRSGVREVEPVDTPAAVKGVDGDGDEGFTTASVKNQEGISFARRVPIRQDGKARAEREVRQPTDEKSIGRKVSAGKDPEVEANMLDEKVSDYWREERFESTVSPDYVVSTSSELVGLSRPAQSQHRHESAFTECSGLLCTVTERSRDPRQGPEWSGREPQGPYLMHSALSQHTEDLISEIETPGDIIVYSPEKGERVYRAAREVTEDTKVQSYSDAGSESLSHDLTPRALKKIEPMGISPAPLEIQIPRSVFYVAEEVVETRTSGGQINEERDREESKGIETRHSWRIGKPLSRVESLREKIRQQEVEGLKQREDGGESEGAEVGDTAEDWHNEREEWEAAGHTQKRLVEEREQEDAAEQTSMTAFDVTQEVGVLKSCPQLPVSVPHSQALRGDTVTSAYATASEATSDDSQVSEDEDDPVRHVEEQLRCHRGQHENGDDREEEEDEQLSEEEELEEDTSPPDSVQSLSPSPTHCDSLAAMSRIYNLETIGSRSGLCLRQKTVDVPSVHLVQVKPLISSAQRGDSKAPVGEDLSGVQTVQRQIEQFQLVEQEALKSWSSPNTPLKDRETKGQRSRQGLPKHRATDEANGPEKDRGTSNLEVTPQRVRSPTSHLKQSNQSITVCPPLLRSQSPDNTLKPSDCAPTPASSPSSLSPAQSPSVSPSPTASPTLFSIRSASGGKGNRGATITISPRKPAGGGGGGAATGPTAASTVAGATSTASSSQPAQTTSTHQVRKKFPTVEEIEVIGGYKNLERSCLIKSRGTPKRVKVCFDEEQLEQVCEYPSETSMLSYTPYPHDLWKLQGEEAQEEEAEGEDGTITSKSTRHVGTAMGRGLRVDESRPQ